MTHYLPRTGDIETEPARTPSSGKTAVTSTLELEDSWGADACRLHHLIHLIDTGRIKDGSSGLPPESSVP